MTYPRLTDQQRKDLARFARYLRESDAKDLLTEELGSCQFDWLVKKIYDTFNVTPQKTSSGLTYITAEKFAHNLTVSLCQTVKASIMETTDRYYDAHAVEQCGDWLKVCHWIEAYNN